MTRSERNRAERPASSRAARSGAAIGLAGFALALAVTTVRAADADVVQIGTFDRPLYVAVAPGQPELLFVVEQTGQVQVLRNEQPVGHAFLDIRNRVQFNGERGLLSIAFAPDYASSGRFYVAFNNAAGAIELDEFKVSSDPTRADRRTRRVLLRIPHSGAANHNGGQLQFGPVDNLLYMSTGDGGDLTPPGDPARNLTSLLGKILRINPLPTATAPYRIPRSNPFVGRGGRDEIYAYGFRNPWRFSFDGARMAIADVGESQREEVNFLRTRDVSGVNFGWPQFEGDIVFDNSRPGPDPAKFPMFVYSHAAGRCAIIGGFVVHDPNLPSLIGRYLYGDLCSGEVRSFVPRVAAQRAAGDRAVGVTLPQLSGFGQGFNGVIYLAQITGKVWRLVPP